MCTVLRASDYLANMNDINLHETTVKGNCKEHAHDFVEIGYVVSGTGTHIIAQQPYHIGEGEMFLINPNVPHEFTVESTRTMTVRNCLFAPDILGEFNISDKTKESFFSELYLKSRNETNSRCTSLTKVCTAQVAELFCEMYEEYQHQDVGYMQIIQADLAKMLIQMFRYANSKSCINSGGGTAQQRQIVSRAIAYMKAHYAESITCEELARQCHVSVSYFSKIFHEATGCSVIQMLQNCRIEAAKKLLDNTQYTVNEIAYRVGYADMKHFYRVFRKLNNCTPGEYRERSMAIFA